jgi:hypothetical protein
MPLLMSVNPHRYGSPCGRGDAARLAILFSGGIDCAIIAFLAHKCVILD